MSRVLVGARWDGQDHARHMAAAMGDGLLDFVEANYPLHEHDVPTIKLPIYVHTADTAISSAFPLNWSHIEKIRSAADRHQTPWIGEHLSLLNNEAEGNLGYLVNTPLLTEYVDVAVENLNELTKYYARPIALELGPHYQHVGSLESEFHLLADVAGKANTWIIVDLAHALASNRNQGRSDDYGLDVLPAERIKELHIAGIRSGGDGAFWHDAHYMEPDAAVWPMLRCLAKACPNLSAVTFEYDAKAPLPPFLATLRRIREHLS